MDPQVRAPGNAQWWLDEYLTVVITAPLVFAFVPPEWLPGGHNPVHDAFIALAAAPSWYPDVIFTALGFAYGPRLVQGIRVPLAKLPFLTSLKPA